MREARTTAIILAAGSGTRMNKKITKQLMLIGGISVLERTLTAFARATLIDDIVVVAKEEELSFVGKVVEKVRKPIRVVIGGKSRAESARHGFEAVSEDTEFVAIHDAARCLISPAEIDRVVELARHCGAAFAACAVTDTIKVVDSAMTVTSTVPRSSLVAAQTPQVFDAKLYRRAIAETTLASELITDDNMLLESIGIYPRAVEIGKHNIKITTPLDVEYAEFLLSKGGAADD